MPAFGVLGPLELRAPDGAVIALPRRKQRELLALLLLRAGAVVSADEIVDVLWGERPPASARANLHSYVSVLRGALERAAPAGGPRPRLTTRGYRLDLRPGESDADLFDDLVAGGRRALAEGRWVVADERLTRALGLWRGNVLEDLEQREWLLPYTARLEQTRLAATEDQVEVRLLLGHHADLVTELATTVAQHPLRERLWGQYVLALHRAGRRAEALAAYDTLAEKLETELGVRPSAELRGLRRRIHTDEPVVVPHPPAVVVVPRQLPPDVAGFAGRADHLARLDALLGEGASVTAVTGTAGVGKTALAVHWAHRVAGRFPDGQVYVNLRGFDPAGSVVGPSQALRTVLEAFDVPPQRIPAGLDGQVGLYRSVLAGRRVLIVLDNARDAGQVRPLLPGAPGCLAVVTSRGRLAGLVAVEGAHPLALDLLTTTEARDMLARRLGARQVDAAPAAVDEIIERCARLPIALAVVAARAATNVHFGLDSVVAELRGARRVLDAFDDTEPVTDVRAVFSWSYRTLGRVGARMFRLLGLHPAPDITVPAAADLAGVDADRAGAALTELARANLLAEIAPGRYAPHDLLKAYAAELALHSEPATERRAATRRVLDHYLATAGAADRLLRPDREPVDLRVPPDVHPEPVDGYQAALDWFGREHRGLLVAIDQASRGGHAAEAWRLAWALESFFDWRGHWHELAAAQRSALDAAERDGDLVGQAHTRHGLARCQARMGEDEAALEHLDRALDLFGALSDEAGQAAIECSIGYVLTRLERHHEALRHDHRSLALYRACGDVPGQIKTLNNVGYQYALLGQYQRGLDHCEQSLALSRTTDSREYEAQALDSLGYAHARLGHHGEAVDCYRRAVDLMLTYSDRAGAATTLTDLGAVHQAAGDRTAAREVWTRALGILTELRHPDEAALRARLDGVTV